MSINCVYVVNYYNSIESISISLGVFKKHDTAVDYVTVNSSHSFSHDLNKGGCDICKKMISDDEIEYVCTQCADYHLCVRCFRPTKMKHNCKIEEELLEIKRDISDNNYAEDKTGSYTIENVRYV